jgi:hypothetical protein
MLVEAIGIKGWLVGKSATHVINRYHPMTPPEMGNEMSIIIRPGGIAVHHDYNWTGALVNIMETATLKIKIVACEGIVFVHCLNYW